MALRPEDRYPSSRELAEDLERWLADQPVSAYRDPLSTRVLRRLRRHRYLVTSAAVILVLALVGIIFHDRRLAKEHARVVQVNDALRDQFRLIANELAKLRDSDPLRESLTKKMLNFYQELRTWYPDDLDIRYEMAEVYRILAMVRRTTGQLKGALDCHRRATSHYLTLIDHPQKKYLALRGLVQTLTDCGELYRMSGRTSLAVAEYNKALGYCDRLAADPVQSYYRTRKSELLINQSELLIVQGRFEEACADTGQAVEILEMPPPKREPSGGRGRPVASGHGADRSGRLPRSARGSRSS